MQTTDKRLYSICRCCGFAPEEEFYFYSHYGCGDFIICRCCGCESGVHDWCFSELFCYRHRWLNKRARWMEEKTELWLIDDFPSTQKKDWSLKEQFKNIPKMFMIREFLMAKNPLEKRNVCRICGYEGKEELYNKEGYPNYLCCSCCGGWSGMSDFDLKELLCERHAFFKEKKWHVPSLKPKRWDLKAQLLNIPQEFQTPIPSYIPPLKERSICRICGFESKKPNFFYDQEGYPTYEYCERCRRQSGVDDYDLKHILRERYYLLLGIRDTWFLENLALSPEEKEKELQEGRDFLKKYSSNIPEQFQTPIPSFIPPLKERSICKICGFENKEPNFFYDQEGYPTYSYCNSCGGQSGYHDFDAESILKRQEAVEICKNMYDQYLDFSWTGEKKVPSGLMGKMKFLIRKIF